MEDEVVAFNLMPWALAQRVSNSTRTVSWMVRSASGWTDLDETSNPFWVTWASPCGSTTTAKRVNWVTEEANGCDSTPDIGEAIWTALLGDPPCEFPDRDPDDFCVSDWRLLDTLPDSVVWWGQCDQEAAFMQMCLSLLGVASQFGRVYPSWDVDCSAPDFRAQGQPVGGQVCNVPGHFQVVSVEQIGGRFPSGTKPHRHFAFCWVEGEAYCLVPPGRGMTQVELLRDILAGNQGSQAWHYLWLDHEGKRVESVCQFVPNP